MSKHNLSPKSPSFRMGTCIFASTIALLALCAGLARAATVVLKTSDPKNNQQIEGVTIDMDASDEQTLVVRGKDSLYKIPRTRVVQIVQEDGRSSTTQKGNSDIDALAETERALASNPGDPALQSKVQSLRHSIQFRERLNYSALFDTIDRLIADKNYADAVKEADAALGRIRNEGARTQCRRLKAQAHIGLARGFRDNVNFPEEEANYKAAIEADPENPVAPLEMASLLEKWPTRINEAVAYYESGTRLAENHPGLIDPGQLLDNEFRLGQHYLNVKRFVAAGDKFLRVTQSDTALRYSQSDDMVVVAYSRIPLNELEGTTRTQIVANLKQLLVRKPHKQMAYMVLGRIGLDQQDWADAAENMRLAVANADPGSPGGVVEEALFTQGICLRKLHKNAEAGAVFEKLLGIKGGNYDAMCELAEINLDSGDYADAGRYFTQALAIDNDKYRAHLGKGFAFQRQGQFDDARKSFKAVLDRDKTNIEAQLAYARSFFDQKRYDETITEANAAITMIREKYSDKPKAKETPSMSLMSMAGGLAPSGGAAAGPGPMKTGTPAANAPATGGAAASTSHTAAMDAPSGGASAEAMPMRSEKEDAALLVKISPEDRRFMAEANTLIGNSNILSTPARTNVARDNFNEALKFEPNHADAYQGLGMSFAADKIFPQAEENFQKAIAIDPNNADYYLGFAVYWHQDRKSPEKALPLYQKYQELGGKDPLVAARIKEISGMAKKN